MIQKDGKVYYNHGDDFRTPTKFFDYYNRIFGFTVDVAASDENHKCERYYTVDDDGLSHSWGGRRYGAIHHTAEKPAIG